LNATSAGSSHAEPPAQAHAMSPALNNDMVDVLNTLEVDETRASSCLPVPATRGRPVWNLREFFREVDAMSPAEAMQARRSAGPMAVAHAHELFQAHDRDGQRLVLRRGVSCRCLVDLAIAPTRRHLALRDQLGIIPRQRHARRCRVDFATAMHCTTS